LNKVQFAARINANADNGGRPAPQKTVEHLLHCRPASFSTGDSQTFKRAIDMTDDELAAIASRATLHVVK
jgi:hypothetical protein